MSSHFVVMSEHRDHDGYWIEDRKVADFTDRHRAEIFVHGYEAALTAHEVTGCDIVIRETD